MKNTALAALVVGASIVVAVSHATAQQAKPLTLDELVEANSVVLHYAFDTLKGVHSISNAVAALRQNAATNSNLVAHLELLTKTEADNMRNLATWCLETAFPNENATWKNLIRSGKIIDDESLRNRCAIITFALKVGELRTNLGECMRTPFGSNEVAMTVADLVTLYGKPDRTSSLMEDNGTKCKWFFYGPVAVLVDASESTVFKDQLSMCNVVWYGAFKAYGHSVPSADVIPDMSGVFLKIGGGKSTAKPRPR